MSLSNKKKDTSTGVWIPEEILRLPLGSSEKLIIALIAGLSREGDCTASNTYIGDRLGISPRHVRRMLSTLNGNGYIENYSESNSHALVLGQHVLPPPDNMSYHPGQHVLPTRTTCPTPPDNMSYPYIGIDNKEDNKLISLAVSDEKNTTLDFDEKTIQDFKTKYPTVDVEDEIETARLWLASTGKKYKNYKAFTHNWLRRKRQSSPISVGKYPNAMQGISQNAMPTREDLMNSLTIEEREDLAREKFLRIQNTPGVPA